jgi:DNA-binding NarL/FixJ family response regulator
MAARHTKVRNSRFFFCLAPEERVGSGKQAFDWKELVASNLHERAAILVGQQPLLLDAVGQMLERVPVRVLAKLSSPQEAVALAVEHDVDLLMIDIEDTDPESRPLASVRAAVAQVTGLRVVVMASSGEPHAVHDAFAAGANAYVLKRTRSDDVATVVRQLFDQSIYHAPIRHAIEVPASGGHANGRAASLTRREHEILSLVVEGRTNGEIAKVLWVTEQTVKFHLANIYRKLGVTNRTQASYWAHGLGIVAHGEWRLAPASTG